MRTAAPAIPGTDPKAASASAVNEDLAQAVVEEGLRAETAEQRADRLEAEMQGLKALVHQLGKNQAITTQAPVEHPDMADVIKKKPTIPVLTKEGWYVPEVHPSDRIRGG